MTISIGLRNILRTTVAAFIGLAASTVAKADVRWTFASGSGVTGGFIADSSGNITSFSFITGGETYSSTVGSGWGFTNNYFGSPYLGAYSSDNLYYAEVSFGPYYLGQPVAPSALGTPGTTDFSAYIQSETTYQNAGNANGLVTGADVQAPEPVSASIFIMGLLGLAAARKSRE
jgi:hypothetical protein